MDGVDFLRAVGSSEDKDLVVDKSGGVAVSWARLFAACWHWAPRHRGQVEGEHVAEVDSSAAALERARTARVSVLIGDLSEDREMNEEREMIVGERHCGEGRFRS